MADNSYKTHTEGQRLPELFKKKQNESDSPQSYCSCWGSVGALWYQQ